MIACPTCKCSSSWVVDKRNKPDGRVLRRRQCDDCGGRYTTSEVLIAERYRTQTHDPMQRLLAKARRAGRAHDRLLQRD